MTIVQQMLKCVSSSFQSKGLQFARIAENSRQHKIIKKRNKEVKTPVRLFMQQKGIKKNTKCKCRRCHTKFTALPLNFSQGSKSLFFYPLHPGSQ